MPLGQKVTLSEIKLSKLNTFVYFTGYGLLFTVYSLLFTVYCLLFTVFHFAIYSLYDSVTDTCQHQCTNGIVHHRLVIDGEQLLAHPLGYGIKAGTGAAGENDGFHTKIFNFCADYADCNDYADYIIT